MSDTAADVEPDSRNPPTIRKADDLNDSLDAKMIDPPSSLLSLSGSCRFSKRDILLVRDESSSCQLSIQRSPDHVGSNRLQVLCDMYRQKAVAAAKGNQEDPAQQEEDSHDKIVQEIVAIVKNQYQAKFVVVAEGNELDEESSQGQELSDQQALDVVRDLLFQQRLPDPVPSSMVSNAAANIGELDDETKKRRRRSTLLRRSVGEDGTAISLKNFRSMFAGRTQPKSSSISAPPQPPAAQTILMDQAEPLDVIWNATHTGLLVGNLAGNNRLGILCSIKEQPYQAATTTLEQQQATVDELYETVTDRWGGRFLAQAQEPQGLDDSVSQQLIVLNKDTAKRALGGLLDPESFTPYAPVSSISSAATNYSKRPSLFRRTHHRGARATSQDTNAQLRSAAVASLQQRIKRQGIASKIRSLTTNLLSNAQTGKTGGKKSANNKQFDRFAEANFDTAPPAGFGPNRDHAPPDDDEYYGSRRSFVSQTNSQRLMPPPPPRQRRGDIEGSWVRSNNSLSMSSVFDVSSDMMYGYDKEKEDGNDEIEEEDDDDGGMLAILQKQMQAKASAQAQRDVQQQGDGEGGTDHVVQETKRESVEPIEQPSLEQSRVNVPEDVQALSDQLCGVEQPEEDQLGNLLTGLAVDAVAKDPLQVDQR